MTRINIELPEELHKKIKVACAVKDATIKDYIKEVLDNKVNHKTERNSK